LKGAPLSISNHPEIFTLRMETGSKSSYSTDNSLRAQGAEKALADSCPRRENN
jgi:hypothetical protein